jgi:hypothetical protein
MQTQHDTSWAPEPPCPDDEEHRIMRRLNLNVSGCQGRSCCNMRDIAKVGMSKFGDEDDDALAAVDRINKRV